MSEFRLEYLKRPELLAREFEVAILPIGSTEPHAQHLAKGRPLRDARRVEHAGDSASAACG